MYNAHRKGLNPHPWGESAPSVRMEDLWGPTLTVCGWSSENSYSSQRLAMGSPGQSTFGLGCPAENGIKLQTAIDEKDPDVVPRFLRGLRVVW